MKNSPVHRFTPLVFSPFQTLSNRVVVPPMASETADEGGHATENTLQHYSRLCESQAGLVIVEYSFIHPWGRSEANQLGISDDAQIPGLGKISQTIHAAHALAAIQLTHAGGKTEPQFSHGVVHSPSGVVVPVRDQVLGASTAMTAEDIKQWRTDFLRAAVRAEAAGFDLVEIHAAHGYGMNQWLSPLTNKRTDQYGGNLRNNLRLLLEVIAEIKLLCPTLLISVRMPGQDFIDGGLTQSDCVFIAQELERAGVDVLSISSGIGGWRRPRDRSGEGYLVPEAGLISSQVRIPVIGVGGIESGETIDEFLEKKKIALAAVGRAILKDPGLWGRTHLQEPFLC